MKKQSMTETGRALYDAHLAFELRQWQGRTLNRRLAAEVRAFWDWAGDTPLDCLLDVDHVRAAAERLVLDMALPESLAELIGDIASQLVDLDINRETRIQDVINEALFDDGVALFIELEDLRERIIKRALDSPVYTALASDVLYQGIKDYIFSDNGALDSIPGVSSLIRGSASAVNKRVPGLEAQVEKRVRAYIEDNTARTLARSEALLIESLDDARITAIAAEIWRAIHTAHLSVADVVDRDEVDSLVAFGLRVWRELRQTEYVAQLVDAGVTAFFERYGDAPITDVLERVGVTRTLLEQEAETLAPPVIAALRETGWLEAFLERRLEPFYRSKAFEDALTT